MTDQSSPLKRSGQWAVVRAEAPVMPWDGDPMAVVFPRLARQFGTAFALRHWELLEQLAAILEEHLDDAEAQPFVDAFFQEIRHEHGTEVLAQFLAVYKLSRVIRGGIERRMVARHALRQQKARVRRS